MSYSYVDVIFQTSLPLSQQGGRELWKFADHFHQDGTKRYRLKALIHGGIEESLVMAMSVIKSTVAEEQVKPVTFVDIRAREEK